MRTGAAVYAAEREAQSNQLFAGGILEEEESLEEPSRSGGPKGRRREGPALLQTIFRVLEARGPKDALNMLRDVLESFKLVQAITGTGAAAAFVHANSYRDSRGEAFGVLTALSTILAFLALIVTVIVYISIGLLEHEDMVAVEGYLLRYWHTIFTIVMSSVLSLILLVAAVVVDAFRSYSRASALCLLASICIGFVCTSVFWINSSHYVITSGAGVKVEEVGDARESDDESESDGSHLSVSLLTNSSRNATSEASQKDFTCTICAM